MTLDNLAQEHQDLMMENSLEEMEYNDMIFYEGSFSSLILE